MSRCCVNQNEKEEEEESFTQRRPISLFFFFTCVTHDIRLRPTPVYYYLDNKKKNQRNLFAQQISLSSLSSREFYFLFQSRLGQWFTITQPIIKKTSCWLCSRLTLADNFPIVKWQVFVFCRVPCRPLKKKLPALTKCKNGRWFMFFFNPPQASGYKNEKWNGNLISLRMLYFSIIIIIIMESRWEKRDERIFERDTHTQLNDQLFLFSYFVVKKWFWHSHTFFSCQTKTTILICKLRGGEDGCICTYVLEEDEYILMN